MFRVCAHLFSCTPDDQRHVQEAPQLLLPFCSVWLLDLLGAPAIVLPDSIQTPTPPSRLSLSFRRRSKSNLADDNLSASATASVHVQVSAPATKVVPSYQRVELRPHRPDHMRPLVLLGPNKDIFSDQLLTEFPELFSACVPHTTRSPRTGEVNGVDYHFVAMEEMNAAIADGKFLEVGQYKGALYGTSLEAVQSASEHGVVCIIDASVEALAQMHDANIHPMVLFLKPASVQALIEQNPHLAPERASEAFLGAEKVRGEVKEKTRKARNIFC